MKKILDLPDATVTALRIEAAELGVSSVKAHMQNILVAHAAGRTKVVPGVVDATEEVQKKDGSF